jgi:hypothetical protein
MFGLEELTVFLEGNKRSIDSQRQLHGQLWWYDRGDDEDTVEQEFAFSHSPFQSYLSAIITYHSRQLTLDPDVGTCGNGENE